MTFFATVSGNVSAISNEFLYTGRRLDPETGLQLNRNRFYASHLGRWVNRDPAKYYGGNNLYAYVGGMPTYYIDPSGLVFFDPTTGEPIPEAHPERNLPPRKPELGKPRRNPYWPIATSKPRYDDAVRSCELYLHYSEWGNSAPADPAWLNGGKEICDIAANCAGVGAVAKKLAEKCAKKKCKKKLQDELLDDWDDYYDDFPRRDRGPDIDYANPKGDPRDWLPGMEPRPKPKIR